MKVYMIYHYHYDDCNHLGYCTDEEEAIKISEYLNEKHSTHMTNNIHWYEELELITLEVEQSK